MRRILALLILACYILSMAACRSQPVKDPSAENPSTENPKDDNPPINFIGDEIRNELDENGNVVKTETESVYLTYEEVLDRCTDVVKAECVEIIVKNAYRTEYLFSVGERYCGEITNGLLCVVSENIDVTVYDTDFRYNHRDVVYEVGQVYYLVLLRKVSVYQERDEYINAAGNMFFPAENISNSTMHGTSFFDHTVLDATADESAFLSYTITELNKKENRALYWGTSYTVAEDLSTILAEADVVARVRIKKKSSLGESVIDRELCTLEVLGVYKGNIAVGSAVSAPIFMNRVQVGGEYLVTLTDIGSIYVLSAKESVFEVSREEEILSYLK
ncbi:MAG: hypothetical protein IJY16_09485 [Clostridia bacterium]|nr:hypothetical protein [Clostridia bacterium]